MTRLTRYLRRIVVRAVRDRCGSISIMTAISFTTVAGLVGLGTEASYWYVKQRNMQSAADLAAIAGAAAILSGETFSSGTPTDAANTIAAQYDLAGGCLNTTTAVCVNNPPSAGTHTSDSKAVEVIVSQTQSRLFSGLFTSSNLKLSARAVATQIGVSDPSCVVALDKTKLFSDLTTTGNANVNMPNCNVFINSCDPTGALDVSGNSTYVANASYMCGNLNQGGSSSFTDTNGTYTNTNTTYADPYASSTAPSPQGCTQTNYSVPSGTLQPGTYCGGLTFNSGVNVTLAPGTYVINGTSASTNGNVFQINGGATVTGTGVTIVLTGSGSSASNWATVHINGTSNVSLTAPMPGASSGMPPFVFYQDRNAPATPTGSNGNQFNGTTNMNITGAMYFPTQLVTWNGTSALGSGGTATCTQIVAYQIIFNGTTNFNSNAFNCKDIGITSLNAPGGTSVALVE